jgi:predicted GNAT family acetyltransferase
MPVRRMWRCSLGLNGTCGVVRCTVGGGVARSTIVVMPEIRVHDQSDAHRYVIEVDGERAGLLQYRLEGERISFTHAEIDPVRDGQGLGSTLSAFALDDARSRGLSVLPRCPFVQSYMQRHAEYLDLVPEAERARFGL